MGRAENALQRAVIQFLRLNRCAAWRNNTGAYKVGKRFIRHGYPGSGDVFCLVPPAGHFLSIECKVGANEPSEDQLEWKREVEAAGGTAIVAYNLDEVAQALAEIERKHGRI